MCTASGVASFASTASAARSPCPSGKLIDRGQAEELAELVPVDADDRQLLRHAEAEVASREQGADGHLIRRREHRGRAGSRASEQLLGRPVSALDREVGWFEEGMVQGEAGLRQSLLEAQAAVGGDVEVDVELGVRPDVRDVGVAEADQVLGRQLRDRDVVDREGVELRVRTADRDHGKPEVEQVLGLVLVELDRHRDHGIHALSTQERVEHVAAHVLVGGDVVERDVVAPRA